MLETKYGLASKHMLIPKPVFIVKRVLSKFISPSQMIKDLDHIVKRFGLKQPWESTTVRTAGNSKIVILTTRQGKWILKEYRESTQLPAVLFTHSVLEHLSSVGFPIASLRKTIDDHHVFSNNDRHYAMFEFVPGFRYIDHYVIPKSSERHYIKKAGKTLAHYHKVMGGFIPCGQKHEGFQDLSAKKRWDEYEWHLEEWKRLSSLASSERMGSQIVPPARAEQIKNMLSTVVEQEKKNHALPVVVIHNDFVPYNLLFGTNTNIVYILDFDKSCIEQRAEEVATSVLHFAGRLDGGLDIHSGKVFLDAYQFVNPLTEDEIKQLPYILKRNRLKLVVWMLRRCLQTGCRHAQDLFCATLDLFDWLDKGGETELQELVN